MLFQDKLIIHKERQDVENLSEEFKKIILKEKEIIDLLANAEYTVAYMSMLLLKVEFLIKETQQTIEKVNKTAMIDDVKYIHIETGQQILDRMNKTKLVIQQAIQNLKLANNLSTEAMKQEIQNKILSNYRKDTK